MQVNHSEASSAANLLFSALFKRPPTDENVEWISNYIRETGQVSEVLNCLMNTEEYKLLNREKMFVPAGHFYSPIVPVSEAIDHLDRIRLQNRPNILDVPIDHDEMLRVWSSLLPHIKQFPFTVEQKQPYRYKTGNSAYGYGDAVILFAMMNHLRPRRIIEIGSGWSSVCAMDTADQFLDGACEFTFIEPFPQLLNDLAGASEKFGTIIESRVQSVDLQVFDQLEAGDILFIDSTHVVRTGSDVCFEFFEILPRLKPGVFVHIHDIFWPFEYPKEWIINDNRSWNELYFVRAFLMNSSKWKTFYFNDYFAKNERSRIQLDCPMILDNPGGGLWLCNV